jgi:hypothetical protein
MFGYTNFMLSTFGLAASLSNLDDKTMRGLYPPPSVLLKSGAPLAE